MLLCFFDSFLRVPGSSDAPGLWGFSSCRLTLLVTLLTLNSCTDEPTIPQLCKFIQIQEAGGLRKKQNEKNLWVDWYIPPTQKEKCCYLLDEFMNWRKRRIPLYPLLRSSGCAGYVYVLRLLRPGWVMPWAGPALSRKLDHGPSGIPSSINFCLTYVAENLIPHVDVHMYVPVLVIMSPHSIGATWYDVFPWQGLSEVKVEISLHKISPLRFP